MGVEYKKTKLDDINKFFEAKIATVYRDKKEEFIPISSGINSKDPNIRLLEQNLAEKIGLDVEIKNKKNNKGTIIFSYKELDQLNRIIETIKKNY